MRALCWYGVEDVRVETVPDPKILNPRDAIVEITSTAICGSDLHLYNGYVPAMLPGDILGHEFMGRVVEVGSEVETLDIGDPAFIITHRMSLEDGPLAYDLFKHKKDGCIKVVLKPGD